MYAITGASGKLGRLTVEALLARDVPPSEVVAIARKPESLAELSERGVLVRAGDYDDAGSWAAALAGVDTLLLVSGNAMGRRVGQHTTVIEAARTAGVQRVGYTSILNADTSSSALAPEHLATEQALQASGLAYTVLRNSWYFENYLDQADQFIAQHAVVSAAGQARFTAATRADYAAAAAAALVDESPGNAVYELGGDKITVADVAGAISQASGVEVAYRAVSPDELREILQDAGVPDGYRNLLLDTDRVIVAGELDTDSHDLARLAGRPLTSLADAARALVRPVRA